MYMDLPPPTKGDPVSADHEGTAFNEEWEYRSIVGMIMYLAFSSKYTR